MRKDYRNGCTFWRRVEDQGKMRIKWKVTPMEKLDNRRENQYSRRKSNVIKINKKKIRQIKINKK